MSHPYDLRGTSDQQFPNPDRSQPFDTNLHRNSGNFDDTLADPDQTQQPTPAINAPIDPATFQTEIMQMMRALTQRVNEPRIFYAPPVPAPPVHSPPVQVNEPKAKDPETFHGQRNKLTAFLTECKINFSVQSSCFASDSIKINYMISYLRDSPLLAIRPYLGRPEKPDFLEEYPKFIEYLKTNYGDPDEKASAVRRLNSLRQTSSASAYFSEFKQCVAILDWKEQDPLIDRAKQGLNAAIKNEIAKERTKFTTVEELINFVIPLDNSLYERELEMKKEEKAKPTRTSTKPEAFTSVTRTSTRTNTPASNHGHIPTVFNNTDNSFRPANRSNQPRGPIDNNERARRIENNLCLYCGDSSHQIRDCIVRNRRNQVLNQVQVKIEESRPIESKNN